VEDVSGNHPGGLEPTCDGEEYVFVALPGPVDGPEPVATVAEPEGLTVVLRRRDADSCGLAYDFVAARIVLAARTELDAVGVTAAFASVLAELGISCNVVAGVHHDHLFVPYGRASDAVAAIAGIRWLPGEPGS
jgi:hypothetical protein